MKRAFAGLAIMTLAAIIFSVAFGQASVGNLKHIEMELLAVKVCMTMAVALILWIKIPEWVSNIKDWVQIPRWRR